MRLGFMQATLWSVLGGNLAVAQVVDSCVLVHRVMLLEQLCDIFYVLPVRDPLLASVSSMLFFYRVLAVGVVARQCSEMWVQESKHGSALSI